jgi:hypothetical protein
MSYFCRPGICGKEGRAAFLLAAPAVLLCSFLSPFMPHAFDLGIQAFYGCLLGGFPFPAHGALHGSGTGS